MEENANRLPKRLIWGVGASVLLHVLFLVGFLLTWPVPTPDAPKEEVVNVSIEQPPQEKPKDDAQKQPPPEVKPKPPVPEQRPVETFPPPPPPGPQAFESAQKDEEAPKEEEAPVPPSSEQPAPEEAKPDTAQKLGDDKSVSGDPSKQEPPKEAAVLKDIAPPELGPDARPKQADKPQEAGSGIVTEQRFSLGEGAEQGPPTASVPTPEPKPKLQTTLANMKPAKRLYSKDTLSDPRVKEALGTLPPKRRVVQMCSIEMLEQIRRNVPGAVPDIIAPTAMTKEHIDNQLMDVTDAAYRSRGDWYDISYHCETDAKTSTITSFKFNMGSIIPRSEWESRQLRPN
ncbi:hypothetical protein H4S14_003362 [Agrobacterium vitis]|nr:hypothetical protein [Agrobacterium vitis]MBE1439597.1 hypothetical protein [Agrobacterium vitis]